MENISLRNYTNYVITRTYVAVMTKLQNIVGTHGNKIWLQILDWILKIGHYQILRRKITYELNTACKFEAKHMEAALQTLNTYVYYYTIY